MCEEQSVYGAVPFWPWMRDDDDIELAKYGRPMSDRFCVIDINTGDILDDNAGYGYKSREEALKAYEKKREVTE